MSEIEIIVQQGSGEDITLTAPTDMGLSLMEFLKGNDFDIPATCGGMALCATCHVEVLNGFDQLEDISDDEHAMLDTLPNITSTSRLSCQIRLRPELNGVKVRVIGDGL